MQTFDFYGLMVSCNSNEHIRYMELKLMLERCLENIQREIKLFDSSKTALHSINLGSGLHFSIYIKDCQFHLGIYDSVTNQIYQNCLFQEISSLYPKRINILEIRIINQLHVGKIIPVSPSMQQAWENCLQGRELVNKEINDDYER